MLLINRGWLWLLSLLAVVTAEPAWWRQAEEQPQRLEQRLEEPDQQLRQRMDQLIVEMPQRLYELMFERSQRPNDQPQRVEERHQRLEERPQRSDERPQRPEEWLANLVPAVPTALDMRLLHQVTADPAENQAVSPFVMSSLMTQVFLGTGGTTSEEMRPVLGLEAHPETGVTPDYLRGYRLAIDYLSSNSSNATVAVFNRLYVRRGLHVRPSYSYALREVYGSDARTIDSPEETAADINEAVSNVTRGKIAELVSAGQLNDAQLVLVSALYFKALWQHPFNPATTGFFMTADGERQVDMMSMDPQHLLYANLTTFEAAALPYEDPDYCLLLLRPPQRSLASVQRFLHVLETVNIDSVVDVMFPIAMHVTMPKFKIEAEYSLPEQLQALGIREIFSTSADFSGLTEHGGLFVSDVIHKVFLEVTEEGTEAAGAGAVFFTRSMMMHFALDRPFVAVVYNKRHKLNLFAAYVGSPTSEKATGHGEGTQRRDPPPHSRVLGRVPPLRTGGRSHGRWTF